MPDIEKVIQQAEASERFRNTPKWVDASKWSPMGPHTVLATDLEGIFTAVLQDGVWRSAETEEEIDSVVTHWMELPELPEEEG